MNIVKKNKQLSIPIPFFHVFDLNLAPLIHLSDNIVNECMLSDDINLTIYNAEMKKEICI